MIDWTRVDELRLEIGEDGFAEVVDLFLEEVEEVVSRLRKAQTSAEYEADLHFLKGSAWNLGFTDFGALCQDGERTAAKGHGGQINIGEVIDCYFASKDAFLAGLSALAAGLRPDAA